MVLQKNKKLTYIKYYMKRQSNNNNFEDITRDTTRNTIKDHLAGNALLALMKYETILMQSKIIIFSYYTPME